MVQFHFQTVESCALYPFPVPADQVPDLFADILSGPTLTSIRRNEITERTTDANGHGGGCASFVMRGIQFINLNTGQAATPDVPHRKHRVAGSHGGDHARTPTPSGEPFPIFQGSIPQALRKPHQLR